jgi:hypothetical protein
MGMAMATRARGWIENAELGQTDCRVQTAARGPHVSESVGQIGLLAAADAEV